MPVELNHARRLAARSRQRAGLAESKVFRVASRLWLSASVHRQRRGPTHY
jgi:hypothetical protein